MAAKKAAATNGAEPKGPGTGWTKVDTRVNGFWKPTRAGQFLEGLVVQRVEGKSSNPEEKKPNIYYAVRVSDETSGPIHDGDGKPMKVDAGALVGVSGMTLRLFLDEHMGQPVHMVYRGLGKPKPGQSAPKLYDTYEPAQPE